MSYRYTALGTCKNVGLSSILHIWVKWKVKENEREIILYLVVCSVNNKRSGAVKKARGGGRLLRRPSPSTLHQTRQRDSPALSVTWRWRTNNKAISRGGTHPGSTAIQLWRTVMETAEDQPYNQLLSRRSIARTWRRLKSLYVLALSGRYTGYSWFSFCHWYLFAIHCQRGLQAFGADTTEYYLGCVWRHVCHAYRSELLRRVRRKHPHGMIGLTIFTLATSFFVGIISSIYAQVIGEWIVIESLLMTALIVVGLTIFAFQTKYDFTRFNGFIVALLMWGIMLLMFNFVFIMDTRFAYTLYASCGAAFMCFFIVHDTQLMIGGKHKYQLQVDEHVFAALSLYLDIVNLFLYILSILNGGEGTDCMLLTSNKIVARS